MERRSSQTVFAPSTQRGRFRDRANWLSLALFSVSALGVLQFYDSPHGLLVPPFAEEPILSLPMVAPAPDAFGTSGEVKIRFALPGERVEYPLEVSGDPSALSYQWVRLADSATASDPRPLSGADVVAPDAAGFYQLAMLRGDERTIVSGMTLTVLVPFSRKLGTSLNGYEIGEYVAERFGARKTERPAGFVEIAEDELNLPITKHLRMADFVAHDGQVGWPRYAAVNPRLLDKLELVMAQIALWRGGPDSQVQVALDVHSGFRTPVYNRSVKRSARDSRHQYGDAADVTIDANGDGRVTLVDSKLVVLAVEAVERSHPELVGGLGLYTSRRFLTPYVHIDARGRRARWRG